jgi:hypothetical protein
MIKLSDTYIALSKFSNEFIEAYNNISFVLKKTIDMYPFTAAGDARSVLRELSKLNNTLTKLGLFDYKMEEKFGTGIVLDPPDDSHKTYRYKGFVIKWNKDTKEWNIFNKDGEPEWETSSRKETKDFIDSYY